MANRILIVEDDHDQRTLAQTILSREGFIVTSARDGREAEIKLAATPPDLVLLDVNLPYRNGFEICETIRRNPETRLTPVVLITGSSESKDRIRGIEVGADDFLSKPIEPIELKARIRSLLKRKEYTDELERAEGVLMALGASIEAKDPYTDGHCERISRFAVILGTELGLDHEDLRALSIAGSVHDIGKVSVPDAILHKAAPLSPEEKLIMQQHAVVGERICRPLRTFQKVSPIIRHHHEKQDGSGFPDGLKGAQVPKLARVMQLADIFDALTTDRPYRSALSMQQALEQMAKEVDQGWWDKAMFHVFAALAVKGAFEKISPPAQSAP